MRSAAEYAPYLLLCKYNGDAKTGWKIPLRRKIYTLIYPSPVSSSAILPLVSVKYEQTYLLTKAPLFPPVLFVILCVSASFAEFALIYIPPGCAVSFSATKRKTVWFENLLI